MNKLREKTIKTKINDVNIKKQKSDPLCDIK